MKVIIVIGEVERPLHELIIFFSNYFPSFSRLFTPILSGELSFEDLPEIVFWFESLQFVFDVFSWTWRGEFCLEIFLYI